MEQNKKTTSPLKPVTSIDVAREAKVSQATVSRVFSMHPNVSVETYNKVIQAANRLGYTPNAIARSLSSKRTNIIAIVTIDFVSPHRSTIISKLSKRFQQEGKQILYFETGLEQDIHTILQQILPYQVDGIVITSASVGAESNKTAIGSDIPIVIFNKHNRTKGIHAVCSDNVESGRMVATYLYERGYRSFAYVGSSMFRVTSNLRRNGFVQRLREFGISDCLCVEGNYTYESGRKAMQTIWEKRKSHLPKAVFCADDLMAIGVLDAARYDYSLRVPEDMAICGFDDIEMASWQGINLTTVHQPIDEMVDETCRYIMEQLHHRDESEGLCLFPCSIKERSTT